MLEQKKNSNLKTLLSALLVMALWGSLFPMTKVGYTLWNSLLKTGNISKLSIIKFTEPLFAVVFSWIILGEEIFKLSYLVALLLLISALLIEHRPWRKKNEGKNI